MAITAAQRAAVEAYTGNGYGAINRHLRSGEDPASGHIAHLDALIDAHRLEHRLIVYRGVDGNFIELLEDLAAGVEITDHAFLSTSKSADVAMRYVDDDNGGLLLRISVPAGSKGVDLTPYSHLPDEEEFLLPRGSTMRLVAFDELEDILDLEIVNDTA
jgi:hypothetical protein